MISLENEIRNNVKRTLQPVQGGGEIAREAFSMFPSGIAALCATIEGEATGLVASSFTVGVSFFPPMVMFAVQDSSTTWPKLRKAPNLGVSILDKDHESACYQLASKKGDRFDGLGTTATGGGALLIDGASVWMECQIVSETPAGDHHVIVLEVKSLSTEVGSHPLVFQGSSFHQLVSLES